MTKPTNNLDMTRAVLAEMYCMADLNHAVACGSNADIAKCLRRVAEITEYLQGVNPQMLGPSILQALADRLVDPRGNRTRAAALRNRIIAEEFDWLFHERLAAGERKHGLQKKLIIDIAKRHGVRPRTVEDAISKKHR